MLTNDAFPNEMGSMEICKGPKSPNFFSLKFGPTNFMY